MRNSPLVTVVLPVFNGGRYIEAAVQSILRQDYAHLDVLVIDDGSRDTTAGILRKLEGQDARLRVHSRENRGLIATLNEGLSMARGDLVARMDADDISYRSRISRQVEAFEKDPELGMCGTGFHILTAGDRVVSFKGPVWADEDLATLSKFFCVFRHSTVVFNRKVLGPEILHYDPAYPHAEDFELFGRVSQASRTRILPEPLMAYRMHGNSVTMTRAREMRRTHLRVVQQTLRDYGQPLQLRELLDLQARPSPAMLEEMVLFINAIRNAREHVDPARWPAYDIGAEGMFFFLLHLMQEEYGGALTAHFLDRTNGWNRLRRRERLPIQTFRGTPWLSTALWKYIRELDQLGLQLKSRPLRMGVERRPYAQSAEALG